MPINRFPLFYFNRWQHPIGQELLDETNAFDIRFLKTDMPETETWPAIETSLGFQIGSARDELPLQYHVNAEFLKRAPKLIAVCTHAQNIPHTHTHIVTRSKSYDIERRLSQCL